MLPFRVLLTAIFTAFAATTAFSQPPKIDPGVSQELAQWRAARYSDIRYKLDLTLEKMSPVLKGHMEIRVKVSEPPASAGGQSGEHGLTNWPPAHAGGSDLPSIILDWRKLPGHEKDSTISNVTLNGVQITDSSAVSSGFSRPDVSPSSPNANAGPPEGGTHSAFEERAEHLIFHDGVKTGENVITLDFTSPILTSGSAITRYIDKEDGSEYIYSLFVPSDASTAFPVFDQPDLKARFRLHVIAPRDWRIISNDFVMSTMPDPQAKRLPEGYLGTGFLETEHPISTYLFAFAAGPWTQVTKFTEWNDKDVTWIGTGGGNGYVSNPPAALPMHVYVRKSQAAKFEPHAMETFRLTREAIKYLATYFDYKFPWPKYDLVLIPEFPFGGMEHAGATFLKESSVIFPSEPTKGDLLSRANVIFHETAHQWFGDLVTMRWFDDLWLKEGFAEFMAYKTLEHVMPDANAWKVFYERNKQAAYATDSTRGTTPIYQPIANLSAAKSAYGNIVYRKAPSFLRQAEFYLGPDKFQTAVRAFLKKHEYANATWQDLVGEFENASGQKLKQWGQNWITRPGVPIVRILDVQGASGCFSYSIQGSSPITQKFGLFARFPNGNHLDTTELFTGERNYSSGCDFDLGAPTVILPNYGDYGYGIFLLDDKSREYVLHNIQNEKDPFLRSMMWGALWDSVREAEMDPREYVELVIKQLGGQPAQRGAQVAEARASARAIAKDGTPETDETTIQSLFGRVSIALNYYLPASDIALAHARASATSDLRSRFETVLLDRMQHAETPGLRVTFFRAFVGNASTEHGRAVLKQMLTWGASIPAGTSVATDRAKASPKAADDNAKRAGMLAPQQGGPVVALRAKDKFDIVTRLIILADPDAPKLLADLEKTETSDDAKRYAYAAHAAFATAENRAKFWNDFVNNKDISESWIEAAIGPFNSIRYPELSQPYLERALKELPNLKRTRKIFFINNWLSAWLGGQRDQKGLDIVNKFLADNPQLDNDLRLKILENVDVIERSVRIRNKWNH